MELGAKKDFINLGHKLMDYQFGFTALVQDDFCSKYSRYSSKDRCFTPTLVLTSSLPKSAHSGSLTHFGPQHKSNCVCSKSINGKHKSTFLPLEHYDSLVLKNCAYLHSTKYQVLPSSRHHDCRVVFKRERSESELHLQVWCNSKTGRQHKVIILIIITISTVLCCKCMQ